MTNSPDSKIVALSKEGERDTEAGAAVVRISGKHRAENQEGPMDLTQFLDMMQQKKKRALGGVSSSALPQKAGSRKKAGRTKTKAKDAVLPMKQSVRFEKAALKAEKEEALSLRRQNPARHFLALLGVLTVALLLFGAVLHFAERQARVLSDEEGKNKLSVPVPATPADEKKLLQILSKQ